MILYDIENLNPFELTQEYISHECRMMDKEDVYKWVYEDEKQIENYKKEIERLNNIINELHSDLKTLWIVLWNMDTEMTSYQNEIFDKYYDEFHKEELKESGNNEYEENSK